jgi:hypothetical protein
MRCPKCDGEGQKLYRVPVAKQRGPVPIHTACYFCYLRLTGDKPPRADLVSESAAGSPL